MAAQPDDPFATLPWRQRFGLRRRLRRAWRQGMAEQRAAALHTLRAGLTGVPVHSAAYHGTIAEIGYADGTVVRLWLSHRPAVKALRQAVADGAVVLVQADDHRHCWALYFATLEGRLPLMCRDLRVRLDQGGLPATAPAPPRHRMPAA